MANPIHIDILYQGVEVWNAWRQKNPDIQPDLREANLRLGYIFSGNFVDRDFAGANFSGADLRGANLSGSPELLMMDGFIELATREEERIH
jgi:hypothetical protein